LGKEITSVILSASLKTAEERDQAPATISADTSYPIGQSQRARQSNHQDSQWTNQQRVTAFISRVLPLPAEHSAEEFTVG
jgi:hypothetical protein